jgi:hypothetical protein
MTTGDNMMAIGDNSMTIGDNMMTMVGDNDDNLMTA